MHTKETRHMKPPHFIFPFFAAGVCCVALAMSCLTTPAAAQTADGPAEGNAVAVMNDGLNSNPGGTMVSLTNQITGDALNKSAIGLHDAAWKANKMGASSSTIGGLLERRDSLKNASSKLSTGGVLIDHAGYASTAAGEIAGGHYAQGFITIADGLGKSVVSGLAAATGASFGSLAGPAGTVVGGAAGGYAGSEAWDKSLGRLTSAIKTGLGQQDDKRVFREQSGPKMLGRTSEKIHEDWLNYKRELDDKKKQTVKEEEKKKIASTRTPTQPQPVKGKSAPQETQTKQKGALISTPSGKGKPAVTGEGDPASKSKAITVNQDYPNTPGVGTLPDPMNKALNVIPAAGKVDTTKISGTTTPTRPGSAVSYGSCTTSGIEWYDHEVLRKTWDCKNYSGAIFGDPLYGPAMIAGMSSACRSLASTTKTATWSNSGCPSGAVGICSFDQSGSSIDGSYQDYYYGDYETDSTSDTLILAILPKCLGTSSTYTTSY